MCLRVSVHVCMLRWAFMYVCYDGCSCMCVRLGFHVCVRVGVHVCVGVGIHVCVGVGIPVCVLGLAFMYVC